MGWFRLVYISSTVVRELTAKFVGCSLAYYPLPRLGESQRPEGDIRSTGKARGKHAILFNKLCV